MHRGYRGRRGRGNNDRRRDNDDRVGCMLEMGFLAYFLANFQPSHGPSSSRSRGGRGGRPPGLRGKDIGLYYARKGREEKARREADPTLVSICLNPKQSQF